MIWRRFGWGYAGYVLGIIAIGAIGTKDFLGAGRYLIGAFPSSRRSPWCSPTDHGCASPCSSARPDCWPCWHPAYARGYYLA